MPNQFVTDDSGQKVAVIVPIKQYEIMMEALEELADIKAYDKAKAGDLEYVPAEDMFREIEGKRLES